MRSNPAGHRRVQWRDSTQGLPPRSTWILERLEEQAAKDGGSANREVNLAVSEPNDALRTAMIGPVLVTEISDPDGELAELRPLELAAEQMCVTAFERASGFVSESKWVESRRMALRSNQFLRVHPRSSKYHRTGTNP
jgi:hypothetical protein